MIISSYLPQSSLALQFPKAIEMRGETQPYSQHSSTSVTWLPRVPTASAWSDVQVDNFAACLPYNQLPGLRIGNAGYAGQQQHYLALQQYVHCCLMACQHDSCKKG